jgi:hypothetical protein
MASVQGVISSPACGPTMVAPRMQGNIASMLNQKSHLAARLAQSAVLGAAGVRSALRRAAGIELDRAVRDTDGPSGVRLRVSRTSASGEGQRCAAIGMTGSAGGGVGQQYMKSSRLTDVKWCQPTLTVRVKHLAGSKTLRHAVVKLVE